MTNNIKVKQDMVVLGPDNPNLPKVNFIVNDYLGSPLKYENSNDIIKDFSDLIPGMIVKSIDIFNGGGRTWKVSQSKYGQLFLEDDNAEGIIQHNVDSRNCWVYLGVINKKQ